MVFDLVMAFYSSINEQNKTCFYNICVEVMDLNLSWASTLNSIGWLVFAMKYKLHDGIL